MSRMTYPVQYGQAPAFNQITKRMMADAERQFSVGVYRAVQKAARAISIACLVLFILNAFVLSVIVTDQFTLDTLSMMMSIFVAVFGLMALGMAANSLVVLRKVVDAMAEGTAVEVIGPAFRTSMAKNAQGWSVGPVSMMATREGAKLLSEGAPTKVLCVPKLKAAIAINDVGLKDGMRISFPPNLESMAVQMAPPAAPYVGMLSGPPQAAYSRTPAAQPRPPQTAAEEDIPPPPSD